jgi:aminopeptidase N
VAPHLDGTAVPTETALAVDLDAMRGVASITVERGGSGVISLDVHGLEIADVRASAAALDHDIVDGRLDVVLPEADAPIEIDYAFAPAAPWEGLMDAGATLTWPYHCANLFPCRPEPAIGTRFTLSVAGTPDGLVTVAPGSRGGVAPSYLVAWATGDYVHKDLGQTTAGTAIEYYTERGREADADAGTEHLVEVFSWLERTFGRYPFGDRAGPVGVSWGAGAYGGMEHHPNWHVSRQAMGDGAVQAHEAAHGWWGNGVRIACWEDLVLSEGVVSYLQARALGAAVSADAEAGVWTRYENEWDDIVADDPEVTVWAPETCMQLDPLTSGLFSRSTYLRGAFLFRDLRDAIGVDALDAALAAFVTPRIGTAARFQDLLDVLHDETGFDPAPLAAAWLLPEAR